MRITEYKDYEKVRSKNIKFPGELVIEPSCLLATAKTSSENIIMQIMLSKLLVVVAIQEKTKIIKYIDQHDNYYSIQPKIRKAEVYIRNANMFGSLENRLRYLPFDFDIYIFRLNEINSSDVDFIGKLPDRTIITILYYIPASREVLDQLNYLKTDMNYRNLHYDLIINSNN